MIYAKISFATCKIQGFLSALKALTLSSLLNDKMPCRVGLVNWCTCPAALASKGNSQNVVYQTSLYILTPGIINFVPPFRDPRDVPPCGVRVRGGRRPLGPLTEAERVSADARTVPR